MTTRDLLRAAGLALLVSSSAPALAQEAVPAASPEPSASPVAADAPPIAIAPAPPLVPLPPPVVLELHGGAYLWLYAPLEGPAKPDFSLYFANLVFDAKYAPFGLHFEPRFRDTKLRPFFGSNTWVQEAYVYADYDALRVKVGKVYTHFGKFWDNSFYGNLPYFDGLKLSPDLGVSTELAAFSKRSLRLNTYAQYFVNDGTVNGSLQNRDTVSVPGARKRNEVVLRAEPAYYFNEDTSITLGLSGQYFRADLPDPFGEQNVTRLGADVTVTPIKGLSLYADYAHQVGRHVTDYPFASTPASAAVGGAAGAPAVAGASSRHNHYFLGGAELTVGRVTGRFNFSYVDYADLSVSETMYQPGVVFKVHDHVSVIAEYVNWNRARAGTTKLDHSANLVLYASF